MKALDYIVFFDGECGICNRFVGFVLRSDKKRILSFAPLQGNTFLAMRARFDGPVPDSVVYFSNNQFSIKSTAAIKIMSQLGGRYAMLKVLLLVPVSVRDAIYDFFARNRYAWFGRNKACALVSKEEKARFLD